jgi:hypothetical protein
MPLDRADRGIDARLMSGRMFPETKWLFLIAGMALGLMVGHFSGFRKSTPLPTDSVPSNDLVKIRNKSRSAAPKDERLQNARLARIREMAGSKDYKTREEFTNSLRAVDVPDLLAAFLADAGLEGVDYKQKEMLEKAVKSWVAEDINSALAWAASLTQPKLRRYFQKMMLGELAKSDPFNAADKALEVEAGDAEFDASDVVSAGISELAKMSGNEQRIAELVRKAAVKDGNASHGISKTFAEDFSHEALLRALADIKKEGLHMRFAPMGMLEAWAKRDPEAAHAWSISNGKVGFEEWQDVLSGVAKTSGQDASGEWFLGKYTQADEKQREMMVKAFDDTYSEPAARMVLADRLARQMPADLAAEFVDQVLYEHCSMWSDKQAEGLSLLAWYPSPEERADAMVKHAGYRGVDKLLERFPESRLAQFGVTRGLLEDSIQRKKASDKP